MCRKMDALAMRSESARALRSSNSIIISNDCSLFLLLFSVVIYQIEFAHRKYTAQHCAAATESSAVNNVSCNCVTIRVEHKWHDGM